METQTRIIKAQYEKIRDKKIQLLKDNADDYVEEFNHIAEVMNDPEWAGIIADNDGYDEEYNRITPWAVVQDALDIEIVTPLCKPNELKGVHLHMGTGGPEVWILTEYRKVAIYWTGDKYEAELNWEVCEAIEDYVADFIAHRNDK